MRPLWGSFQNLSQSPPSRLYERRKIVFLAPIKWRKVESGRGVRLYYRGIYQDFFCVFLVLILYLRELMLMTDQYLYHISNIIKFHRNNGTCSTHSHSSTKPILAACRPFERRVLFFEPIWLWSRIHRLLWCTIMIWVILDHRSRSGSSQNNTPLVN